MPSLSEVGKWRRRLRWALWVVLGFLLLTGIGAGLTWYSLERTAAEGKKELAATIAETDALDPRWRWEEIQEDLPPIPDSENSMRVIREIANSLQGPDALPLAMPDGGHLLEDHPPNLKLDDERLTTIEDMLKKQTRSLTLAVSLERFPVWTHIYGTRGKLCRHLIRACPAVSARFHPVAIGH